MKSRRQRVVALADARQGDGVEEWRRAVLVTTLEVVANESGNSLRRCGDTAGQVRNVKQAEIQKVRTFGRPAHVP